MRRILVLGALIALMAVRGVAEDPKPEQKKDPFLAFKLDAVVCDSPDPRVRLEDLTFYEGKPSTGFMETADFTVVGFKFTWKSLTDKKLVVLLHVALFDEEHKLIAAESVALREKDSYIDAKISGKYAGTSQGVLHSRAATKAKYYQYALSVEEAN